MKPLRVAVVGVGHLGRHHARILGSLPGVELVAVADSRPEQAQAVAESLGTRAVLDYRELIGRVDAVSVAVPTVLHREVAGAFLENGVPAMVEKPLAGTIAEAEELVAIARSTGAALQVGHIERFNPAFSTLQGSPIRPRFLSAERLAMYTFRSTDVGVVFDLMIHDIDLVLSLVDSPVRSVSAVGVGLFGDHEDVADARIEFANGTVANLSASRASYATSRKMRIWGAEGYASLDFAAKQATVVRPSDEFLAGGVDLEGVDLAQPAAIKEHLFGKVLRVDRIEPPGCDQLTLELQDFVDSVRNGTRPRVTGEDALAAVRLADQIVRAIDAHRWEGDAQAPPPPAHAAEAGSALRGPHAWSRSRLERLSRTTS
ncbi:Gfo/Idh/MocA family protein [Planctomyces sp. SH-PL62]|uniref:Gfo/Idh/MocA family protein n=1 Tax=Planctomyces sp. SH-PL62 TaxID=1636152 RepID=UPI00078DDCC5|nr:Gfo/Idh/MocA family oxidoreductase [Planctomyces sp. SH-PL62]AMV39758.1 4-carboxy-2-hydroxymuconate-6-semialdehyde dehydrogenase [Planctomyces sp. SH-PL62]